MSSLITSPVDDHGFTDGEQHDGDLGNGEEAPDGGLFKEVGGDQTGQVGTGGEEDDALDDHTSLFVEGKEGSEHQERVKGNTGDNVSGVSHGNGPGKVVVSSESAELFTTEPFSGGGLHGGFPDVVQQESGKEHTTTDQAKSLDDQVSILILFVLGEGSVDNVAEIGLEANVEETQDGEDLVDDGIANGGINVGGNEEILDGLQ